MEGRIVCSGEPSGTGSMLLNVQTDLSALRRSGSVGITKCDTFAPEFGGSLPHFLHEQGVAMTLERAAERTRGAG